jgi:hypothetical protein
MCAMSNLTSEILSQAEYTNPCKSVLLCTFNAIIIPYCAIIKEVKGIVQMHISKHSFLHLMNTDTKF